MRKAPRFPHVVSCSLVLAVMIACTASPTHAQTPPTGVPDGATPFAAWSSAHVSAYVADRAVWLVLDATAQQTKRIAVPRLCAPLRSIHWSGDVKQAIEFTPEITEWVFSWKEAPAAGAVIEIQFDADPVLPEGCPPATPSGDGSVMLHAYQALTTGEKLRFEPQWYKNTVGYWVVPTDYATWNLNIDQPGTYSVAVLQGCGAGQGGSEAVISLQSGDAVVDEVVFVTTDTEHFQNFRWQHVGRITVPAPGECQLHLRARHIAKGALFDVRMIHLVKQAK